MFDIYDAVENLKKEWEHIEEDYDVNDICNEYCEDDLLLYETGNRMSGAGGVFFLRKDGKNRIIYVDEENDLLYKNFPIAMNLESKYEDDFKNEKYNHIFTGFGGKQIFEKLNLTLEDCKFK